MRIAVLRESAPHEHRVSLVPAAAKRLVAAGHAVAVEAGAGESASFPDPEYVSAGATITTRWPRSRSAADTRST